MSGKLDQSLDAILVNNRQANRQSARRRATQRAARRTAVGGVKKNTKAAKAAGKGTQSGPSAPPTDSKIIVSGLPSDVNEANIKEYFTKAAGPVKRVMLTYNQNGTSRGIATIIFGKPDTAGHAAKELNGLLVDGRPMRIEVVLDASHAPEAPAPKPLTERVVQKSKPKPATETKAGSTGRRGRRARGGRNPNRPQRKTVEELDAEMVDYYASAENGGQAAGNAPNGTQQATGGGEDLGMAEIS